MDEIGSREDVQAIEYVRNCGCSLAATIHGSSLEDIMQKPAVGELIHQGAFERMILLDCGERQAMWRLYGTAGEMSCMQMEAERSRKVAAFKWTGAYWCCFPLAGWESGLPCSGKDG